MELIRFDGDIEHFTAQPVTIQYSDSTGTQRCYTPDGLIVFKRSNSFPLEPILYEVKYREDFRNQWRELLPKFRAAKNFCIKNGWRFHIYTEKEIRTHYLLNIKFLWPYREREVSKDLRSLILRTLWDLDESDPDLLIHAIYRDPNNRAQLIPALWHLISIGAIGCNLDIPLKMNSPIWALQEP